ncbi:hypothetical protein AM571_CH03983 [Rhizobium etli 8C-3]|uniref:Uncharacterized protein n=2 Tax=Rhizobium TaxID=379 RepID=A0A1L5P9K9_RHIET|nr:hypothetical protein AM571_CH03983 [Rhizobium etli 8C-3]TCU23839.1 hypothetical protein EV130_107194 [Rhizobium azibense]
MAQIILNTAVAVLVASAFLMTASGALSGGDMRRQRVPVRVKIRRARSN